MFCFSKFGFLDPVPQIPEYLRLWASWCVVGPLVGLDNRSALNHVFSYTNLYYLYTLAINLSALNISIQIKYSLSSDDILFHYSSYFYVITLLTEFHCFPSRSSSSSFLFSYFTSRFFFICCLIPVPTPLTPLTPALSMIIRRDPRRDIGRDPVSKPDGTRC